MGEQSPVESLSNKIFADILNHVTIQDLTSLCLVSHNIYHCTAPKLCYSWSYNGLTHSDNSLKSFLKTIIWRPDLAAHVKVLDLRDWGDVPKRMLLPPLDLDGINAKLCSGRQRGDAMGR